MVRQAHHERVRLTSNGEVTTIGVGTHTNDVKRTTNDIARTKKIYRPFSKNITTIATIKPSSLSDVMIKPKGHKKAGAWGTCAGFDFN